MMRTNYCGELNRSHVGQNVTLSGWVHRVRNLGRFIFMQIRDREGVVQVFFDEKDETLLKWHQACVQKRACKFKVK